MKNWKTTLAAVILAIVGIATSMHYISVEVGGAIITLAGSAGLAVAKDHNATGK